MANGVCNVVLKCVSFTTDSRINKAQQKLRLSTLGGSLGFVDVDILGTIPKTEDRHKYNVVITNQYTKLTK